MRRWRIDWTARPGRRCVLALVFIAAAIYACQESVITGPSGGGAPPPTTSTLPVDIRPPRVDAPFEWENYHGFTAFASGEPSHTEEDIRTLFGVAMANGWNTARKCSETEFWPGTAALPIMPRDLERLEWWLDIAATIPGAQVLLIGDCTLKGPVPEEDGREWARKVGKLAAKYENVAVETHNEYRNCGGRGWGPHCPRKSDVAEHIRIYRNKGVEFVTADQGICKPDLAGDKLGFRLANAGAWPADFHPCRDWPIGSKEPWDPNKRFLREMVARNGMVLLSETVALMDTSGICDGLRTCDHDRIQRYVDACAQVDEEGGGAGCKFTFHSEALLAGLPPTWWPVARR